MWNNPFVPWACPLICLWEGTCEIQFSNEENGWLRLSPPAHSRLLHLLPSVNRMITYQPWTFMGPCKEVSLPRLPFMVHCRMYTTKEDLWHLTDSSYVIKFSNRFPPKMYQSRPSLLVSRWLHEKILMFAFCWLAQKKSFISTDDFIFTGCKHHGPFSSLYWRVPNIGICKYVWAEVIRKNTHFIQNTSHFACRIVK